MTGWEGVEWAGLVSAVGGVVWMAVVVARPKWRRKYVEQGRGRK